MARVLAVAILVAALSVAGEVRAAHDPAFATTPTSAAVGDEIFFNGSNCPESGALVDGTVHFLNEGGRASSTNQVATFEVTDEVFAGTFRVPDVAPGFNYEVHAICFSTGAAPFGGSVGFNVQDYETPTGPPPSSAPAPEPGLLGGVAPDGADAREPAPSPMTPDGGAPPNTAPPTTSQPTTTSSSAVPMPGPVPAVPGPAVPDPDQAREAAFDKLRTTFIDLRDTAVAPLLEALRLHGVR